MRDHRHYGLLTLPLASYKPAKTSTRWYLICVMFFLFLLFPPCSWMDNPLRRYEQAPKTLESRCSNVGKRATPAMQFHLITSLNESVPSEVPLSARSNGNRPFCGPKIGHSLDSAANLDAMATTVPGTHHHSPCVSAWAW